jgi:hypothetical protein
VYQVCIGGGGIKTLLNTHPSRDKNTTKDEIHCKINIKPIKNEKKSKSLEIVLKF